MLVRVFGSLLLLACLTFAQPLLPTAWGPNSELLARTSPQTPAGPSLSLEPGTVSRLQPLTMSGQEVATAPDGTTYTLWRVQVPGASAFRLHVEQMHLPAGSRVLIYGTDGLPYGPFTRTGPLQSGEFWTKPIAGEQAVIEWQTMDELPVDRPPFQVTEVAALPTAPTTPFMADVVAPETPNRQAALFHGQMIMAEQRDGVLLIEGDIALPPAAANPDIAGHAGMKPNSFGVSVPGSLWPNGVLPYTIDPNLGNLDRVTTAVTHWNTMLAGSVRLVPRTTEANYVQFEYNSSAGSCFSQVGLNGGVQYVNLGDYCSTGNVIHEIGHTLGLWHEHTRLDRDNSVIVHSENIDPSYAYNFTVQTWNAGLLGSYDYNSIMHYSAYAFSSNGAATIETIPAGIPIGQRNALSSGDIAGVRMLYPQSNTSTSPSSLINITIATNPPGQAIVVDGVSAVAPQIYPFSSGSTHTISVPTTIAGAGSRSLFSSWSNGGGGGGASQTIVTPAIATTFTANYTTQFAVTANVSPAGTGTVAIAPAANDSYYLAGSTLTLVASGAPGYCLANWSGTPAASTSPVLSLGVDKSYSVTANMGPSTLAIDRYSSSAGAAGGTAQVAITTAAGCGWSATTNADWIVLNGPASFAGPGTLSYLVLPNSTGLWRYGAVRIGNSTFVVIQSS